MTYIDPSYDVLLKQKEFWLKTKPTHDDFHKVWWLTF